MTIEMTDTAVDEAMLLLRDKFREIGGLEPAGLGQCQKRTTQTPGSLPRFSPATGPFRPFVPVINLYATIGFA